MSGRTRRWPVRRPVVIGLLSLLLLGGFGAAGPSPRRSPGR
ncbi:MAG: hypothetical protein RI538_01425 [Salibaculum sp.]|nr:hypothetical protein [Salibaculum sp.]MDR9426873.1 hypothetical protein [Salibaculum sp.]MDR9481426.1 hypothetical protein [Salibaculum sp.]